MSSSTASNTGELNYAVGGEIVEILRFAQDDTVSMRRTTMAKGCLYCDLQLPDTTDFCPQCGRPIERGFEIRPISDGQEPDDEKDCDSVPGTRKGRHYISKFQIKSKRALAAHHTKS